MEKAERKAKLDERRRAREARGDVQSSMTSDVSAQKAAADAIIEQVRNALHYAEEVHQADMQAEAALEAAEEARKLAEEGEDEAAKEAARAEEEAARAKMEDMHTKYAAAKAAAKAAREQAAAMVAAVTAAQGERRSSSLDELSLVLSREAEAEMADDATVWIVVCPRPIAIREEDDWESALVGEATPGEKVRIVKVTHPPCGVLRVLVRRHSDEEIIGWVTHLNDRGIPNLMRDPHPEPIGQRWRSTSPEQRRKSSIKNKRRSRGDNVREHTLEE